MLLAIQIFYFLILTVLFLSFMVSIFNSTSAKQSVENRRVDLIIGVCTFLMLVFLMYKYV